MKMLIVEASYSFVPRCSGGESHKMHQEGEHYRDFLKWGCGLLGHLKFDPPFEILTEFEI